MLYYIYRGEIPHNPHKTMLFQKTFTQAAPNNLNETNYYFEYKKGDEFGYFVEMKYGNIQYELRLEAIDFCMKLEGIKKFDGIVEGWTGDKFCNNGMFMTPEDLAMSQDDSQVGWTKYSSCNY